MRTSNLTLRTLRFVMAVVALTLLPMMPAMAQTTSGLGNRFQPRSAQNQATQQRGSSRYGDLIKDANSVPVPAQTASAQVGQTSAGNTHSVVHCMVSLMPDGDIEVPALESGQLVMMSVKKGDSISAGKIIGKIDDSIPKRLQEQAQFNLKVAKQRASDPIEIKAAERKYQLSLSEFNDQKRLLPKGSTSKKEYQRAKYSMEVALLEWNMAINNKEMAGIEAQAEEVNLKGANDSIMRHQIATKVNGVATDVKRQAGEWVTAGETILNVARMDRLHVSGRVEAKDRDPYEIKGKKVTISVEMARGRTIEFQGEIVFVDIKRQGTSAYQVIAEVENRFENDTWMLQPGSSATMNIHLQSGVGGAIGQNQQLNPNRQR